MFKHHLDIHRTTHRIKPRRYRPAETVLPRYKLTSRTEFLARPQLTPTEQQPATRMHKTTCATTIRKNRSLARSSSNYLKGTQMMICWNLIQWASCFDIDDSQLNSSTPPQCCYFGANATCSIIKTVAKQLTCRHHDL